MAADFAAAQRHTLLASMAALLTGAGTLLCCALPAAMVALGAGATLAGLVTAVPQLVVLSAHKGVVFGSTGVALAASGFMLRRARSLPCPADPLRAQACMRVRRASYAVWFAACACAVIGSLFAFVLPRWL